jgi:hypothetical protein
MRPHRGGMILMYGTLGLIVCPLLGISAWLMGTADLKEMNAHRMDSSGRNLTNAGRILGIIGTILFLAILAYFVVKLFFSPWG